MAGGTIEDDFPRARLLAHGFVAFGEEDVGGPPNVSEFMRDEYAFMGKMVLALIDGAENMVPREIQERLTLREAEVKRLFNQIDSLILQRDTAEKQRDYSSSESRLLQSRLDDESNKSQSLLKADNTKQVVLDNCVRELTQVKEQLSTLKAELKEKLSGRDRVAKTALDILLARFTGGLTLSNALDLTDGKDAVQLAFDAAKRFIAKADLL